MGTPAISMDVRRVGEKTAVVDIKGEVTAACEPVLMSAYEAAGGGTTSRLVLNFAGLEYMNSGGIGMLDARRYLPGNRARTRGNGRRIDTALREWRNGKAIVSRADEPLEGRAFEHLLD